MAEYIDKEKAIETARLNYCKDCISCNGVRCRGCGFDDAMLEIESVPAIDVVEVVHGRWETRMLGDDVGYRCSACHLTSDWDTPYCPQCGALMDGKEV